MPHRAMRAKPAAMGKYTPVERSYSLEKVGDGKYTATKVYDSREDIFKTEATFRRENHSDDLFATHTDFKKFLKGYAVTPTIAVYYATGDAKAMEEELANNKGCEILQWRAIVNLYGIMAKDATQDPSGKGMQFLNIFKKHVKVPRYILTDQYKSVFSAEVNKFFETCLNDGCFEVDEH